MARVENDRTVRHLLDQDGKTLVEVADDHVTATRLLDGPAEPTAWRELEAEIVEGTREQLAATVDVLMSAGAGRPRRPRSWPARWDTSPPGRGGARRRARS